MTPICVILFVSAYSRFDYKHHTFVLHGFFFLSILSVQKAFGGTVWDSHIFFIKNVTVIEK